MMRRITLALVLLVGCGADTVTVPGEGDEFTDGRTLVQTFVPQYRAPRVDLILVIDDSPSMRPFARRWAENLGAFVDVIEDEQVEADVRVAITTTSVPGPTCAGPRARGGEPIVESCRAHLEDFVGPDEHGELGGGVEDLSSICADACSLAEIPRVPSLGHDDHDLESLALRPWIEAPHNPSGGNLDGVSLSEALACAGLHGFGGCSFESPIEAAARMVEHMADPEHPMSEFRRDDAFLYIVTIGDEDDCSHSASSATIFDPQGERIFWADASATAPTSAVCSNAALECDDQTCWLRDHALDGTPTDDPSASVLTPPTRLHDALVAAGEFDDPDWPPIVASIGGFSYTGAAHYTAPGPGLDEDDQVYLDGFGVLPGCAASQPDPEPTLRAGPGGRLAEIGNPEDMQFSICDSNWSPVIELFARRSPVQAQPRCVALGCIGDVDSSTALLEPDCVLEEVDHHVRRTAIPTCLHDENGWVVDEQSLDYTLPEGADACWAWLTDAAQQSSDPHDDMSVECRDEELPAEVRIIRGPDSYLPYDSAYQLRCRPCG